MNLIKALKTKKKLINHVYTLFNRVKQYNVFESGETTIYDAKQSYDDYLESVKELVTLKTKIHLANAPIYADLFMLSELKGIVNNLRSLNTKAGKVKGYDQSITMMETSIDTLAKDEMIATYEAEIETIQEKIETFNAVTKI